MKPMVKRCGLENCNRRLFVKKLCQRHYHANWRHGDPLVKKKPGKSKHGLCNIPEYKIWAAIVQRCTNPKNKAFWRYGGNGITIHEPWRKSFSKFIADIGRRPSKQHTLDRYPDNNGNYEPGNVRWATWPEQNRNRVSTTKITFNGKTQCWTDWAIELGVGRQTIQSRIKRGWSLAEALSRPPTNRYAREREKQNETIPSSL